MNLFGVVIRLVRLVARRGHDRCRAVAIDIVVADVRTLRSART